VDAMILLAVNYRVHGPVGMEQYPVPAAPLGKGGKRSEAYR